MAIASHLLRYVFTGQAKGAEAPFLEWCEVQWDTQSGRILKLTVLHEHPHESDAFRVASRLAMTPAFVNAHTHLDLWSEAPIEIRDGESMVTWLQRVNDSRDEDTAEDVADRVKASVAYLQKTGTGTVNDITQTPETFVQIAEAGLQGSVALEYFHPAPWEDDRSPLNPNVLGFYERWKRYQRLWQEMGESNTLLAGISPHSPYNVTKKAWKAIHNALKPSVIHSHLAEFQAELDYFTGKDRSGIDDLHLSTVQRTFVPTDAFADYLHPDLWKPQDTLPTPLAIIAHGSLLTPKQVQAFYKGHPHSVLVTCPRSNLFLHDCTMYTDVPYESDMPVILGTDSAMSCDNLDIRDERLAYMKHHGIEMTAFEGLELLTLRASKALGLGADLGSLELGKLAHASVWEIPEGASQTAEAVLEAILDPAQVPYVQATILNGHLKSFL
jgi:cytosine/adenosine deaminase-related metal-dependent hydrolase